MFEEEHLQEKIYLNQFIPRFYQLPILDAIENKGYKRVLAVLPRRAGKDIAAWNLIIRQALKRIGIYWYILPTYAQGKKVIFDGMTNDGRRFIDFIPPSLIASINSQEMKIRLTNGSLIQVIGSDNVDSLVGANPIGIVFSEFSLQDPTAYQFIRPILIANNGWCVLQGTPRGKNHMWDLWNIAQNFPHEWFSYKMTVEDTQHIPLEEIEKDRLTGEMSDDLIAQEYWCSFERGIEGSYYAKYIDKMRINGQIGTVPWEPSHKVHLALDIGVRDSTSIIWFQTIGTTVHVIDFYERAKEGLEHYVKIIKDKPYTYGKFIAPHDIAVKEWGSGVTRLEKAKNLGINFTIASNVSIEDGIEAVRSSFAKMYIDERNCALLIKSLENYRQEWDSKRKVYKAQPLHNWASHACDAARYMCVSLPKTRDGLSKEDLNKVYEEAMHTVDSSFPRFFRNDGLRY